MIIRLLVPVALALAVLGMAHAPQPEPYRPPAGMVLWSNGGNLPPTLVPEAFARGATYAHIEVCGIELSPCNKRPSLIECESNGDPNAVGKAGERGLFQVHPVNLDIVLQMHYTWDDMFNPKANLEVALEIWKRSGGSFRQWSCMSAVR